MANWFVGLPFDVLGELALPAAPPGLQVLRREDLHLTLAFLGPCGEEPALRAWKALEERLEPSPLEGFSVSLGEAGPLGPAGRFSVIAAQLSDGAARARVLVESLRDELCDAAGARRDLRPALPHVTLARLDRRARRSDRQLALTWAAALDLRSVRACIGRVVLYTAALERGPRRYRVVVQRALAPQTSTEASDSGPPH